MPSDHLSRLRTGLLSLCLLVWTHSAVGSVEVFTVASVPVTNAPDTAAVVELDAPGRLDTRISQDLPANPSSAKKALQARMQGAEWQATLKRYRSAYTGVARAWMLGVEKLPAVVVDSRYVVYGEPDVGAALQEIERARGSNP